MDSPTFFDIHTHVMRLEDADLANLLGGFDKGVGDFLGGGSLSPDYIFTPENVKSLEFLESFLNTLGVMEKPIDAVFELMEKDLRGGFAAAGRQGGRRFIDEDGRFCFRGRRRSKVGLGLMVMDFARLPALEGRLWYDGPSHGGIEAFADETLEAVETYHRKHPDGIFEFYPFLGINPAAHPLKFVRRLLEDRFPEGRRDFYGLKLYPPLGMDPWPAEDREELAKVRLVYEFCVARRLPIVTHCDNQGLRAVPSKTAMRFSSPASWRPVLEEYPGLVVDFAHFGYQYGLPSYVQSMLAPSRQMQGQWFDEIIGLMREYEGVYADLSWTGAVPSFYKRLALFLESLGEEERRLVSSRIMFGSDFAISLLRTRSYNEYCARFEDAPFTMEEGEWFVQNNPKKFLGL